VQIQHMINIRIFPLARLETGTENPNIY